MNEQRKDQAAQQRPDQQSSHRSQPSQRNEGEGNRTAAREYNEAQHRFAQSGKVDEKAREAADARDNPAERREMEHAEMIGRRHAAEEDPAVKR